MDPRKKRLLPFFVIITILGVFLVINLIWAFTLDVDSPLRGTILLIELNLIISIVIVGAIGTLVDIRFERLTRDKVDKKVRFQNRVLL